MNLIKKAADIAAADTADLVFTYNQLTGKSVKRFETRAIAERRVEMALLAAKDADGHTGVPKGADPQPRTRAEIEAKAASRGIEPPPAFDEEPPQFKPGTMAYELDKAAKHAQPIAPRPRKTKAASADAPRATLFAVKAVPGGASKPQPGSKRAAVLAAIKAQKHGVATVSWLRDHLQLEPRGYLQKLIEVKHLVALTESEFNQCTKEAA